MPIFLESVVVETPVETVLGFREAGDSLRLLSPRFPRADGEGPVGPDLWLNFFGELRPRAPASK